MVGDCDLVLGSGVGTSETYVTASLPDCDISEGTQCTNEIGTTEVAGNLHAGMTMSRTR